MPSNQDIFDYEEEKENRRKEVDPRDCFEFRKGQMLYEKQQQEQRMINYYLKHRENK